MLPLNPIAWRERIRPYRIVPLDKDHLRDAVSLVAKGLNTTEQDLDAEHGTESPANVFAAYLRNKTDSGRHQNHAWAAVTKNDPGSLNYFIALDPHNKVIAVSGIYQALPGYSQKIGADRICKELENDHTFWLGWYGVNTAHRGKKIGEDMLRASVKAAVDRAGDTLKGYNYAVYADAGAIGYYEKFALKKVATVGEIDAVMAAPLEDIATALNVAPKKGPARHPRAANATVANAR